MDDYGADAALFKALSDANRLKILRFLMDGEKCAAALLRELNISQSTLSHHMKILCDAGIVDATSSGKWRYYCVCTKGSRYIRRVLNEYSLSPEGEKNYKKCRCVLMSRAESAADESKS